MDDINSCLSQVIHLCLEANLFLNQLYKFESQLSKFYSIPLSILERFAIIIHDFNLYHKNYFVKLHSNIFNYLLHKQHFTVNDSNEILDDIYEDFNHLKYFLNHQNKSYRNIFYYLHKLSITCSLCIQYRRFCTNFELANRFVYLRMDLLNDLKILNDEMEFLLIEINVKFQQRKQMNHCAKERISISDLFRTMVLWFLFIFSIGWYMKTVGQ